jgi:hypothetical protein
VRIPIDDLPDWLKRMGELPVLVLYAAEWSRRSGEQADELKKLSAPVTVLRIDETARNAEALRKAGIVSFPRIAVRVGGREKHLVGKKTAREIGDELKALEASG